MSQIVISKAGRGGRRKLPWIFTEQGVAMLSSVLNSPTAVRVNIEIMRTFVRLRRLMATPGELVEQITKLAETVQLHDRDIKLISKVLQQMMERPTEPRRERRLRDAGSATSSISARIVSCVREATTGSGMPSTQTSVRLPLPRSSPVIGSSA